MSHLTTLEQDRAAGGLERRKMKIRSGEIVIVSLAISGTGVKTDFGVTMRFKMGGLTVERPVGKVWAETHFEQLKLGWTKIREDKVAEANHWSWLVD